MKGTVRTSVVAFAAIALAGTLLNFPPAARASAAVSVAETSGDSVTTAVQSRLNKKQYQAIHAAAENGIVTLTGTVELYEYKADAQKTVLHTKGVTAVRNLVEVTGPAVPDQELQAKLAEKLAYNRVGYGNVFDAIGVHVENGVVTLSGHSHDYPNRDAALATVAMTHGVKDMVDNIEVDPLSQMDDRIRFDVARAVYGFSTLNKYALDPQMPIRISVQNGHVELYGTVDSQADKDMANLRANGVAGVFSVKNYLQVANQPTEKPRK
jgi:hyperosmotically inducible protein